MAERQPWEEDPDKWKQESLSSFPSEKLNQLSRPWDSICDLLTVNDVEIPQLLAEGKLKPQATVTFSRVKYTPESGVFVQTGEQEIARAHLYDLAPYGKTHCIGVGRRPENFFQPKIDEQYWDRTVSGRHGIISLLKEHNNFKVYYRDIGSALDGSSNGTWQGDTLKISNTIVPWLQDTYLSLGIAIKNKDGKYVRMFRLRYQLCTEAKDAH